MGSYDLKKTTIEAFKEPAVYWDTTDKGFGVRVSPAGKKSYILYYRTTGKQQRQVTIGTYPTMTPHQAREIARRMLHEAREGKDPAGEKQEARQAPTVAETIAAHSVEIVDQKKRGLTKEATKSQYRTIIEKYIIPDLGPKKVKDLSERDIKKLFHKIASDKPFMANRTLSLMQKFFKLCEDWGLRSRGSNPCIGVVQYQEPKRHRDLTREELQALAEALEAFRRDTDRPRYVDIFTLMLFTGMRVSEGCSLRWTEIDFPRSIIRLADSKTGAKVVFLNNAAIDLLKLQQTDITGPWVFPSYLHPGAAVTREDLEHTWVKIRLAAGLQGDGDSVKPFRIHDLRHNYASSAAGLGLSLPQIGALLGHKSSSTTQRYADLTSRPQTTAANLIGDAITAGMNSTLVKPGDVVELKGQKS